MPANFPSSPTLNQTYSYNGSTWSWTGSYWRLETSQAMTGIAFTYGNAAPSSPNVGDRWIDTTTMLELVYVYDGNSYQWVELSSQAPSTNLAAVSTSITPTANVAYDLGSNTNRWRDLYLSGNSLIIGGATITATGSAIALPSGTTVGGQSVASGGDVATGGGPKITNLQITDNSWTVLDDTAVDTAGGYVLITGTNFVSGAQVYLNQTAANSVAFVSATTLRVTVPALTAGTYIVYVINPDGGTAIRVPGLTASANPAWQTASALPEQYDGVAITLNLVATDATSYTLTSGSLPPGLSLNTGTGAITGTVTGVTVDTVYTFTVRATDAQLQDSPRTFTVTITVSDPYFKLTTLLLSGAAISGNTVIRDSSNNGSTLIVYGDARASNFTPYGTGWSNYFDGSGDWLVTSNVGTTTGDFTLELWCYLDSSQPQGWYPYVFGTNSPWQGSGGIGLVYSTQSGVADGTPLSFNVAGGGITVDTHSNLKSRWVHLALTRSGSTIRAFLNGTVLASTLTNSSTINTSTFMIGGVDEGGSYGNHAMKCWISNFRFVKGSALYTANFTPATSSLTSITNTALLICQSNRFVDNSANNYSLSRSGDVKIDSFNPFNFTNTGVNGSMYFDGSGDYIAWSPATTIQFGTGDFTVEAWTYSTNSTGGYIIDARNSGQTGAWALFSNTNYNWFTGAATASGGTAIVNQWAHVVYVRSGTTGSLFVNGVRVLNQTDSTNYSVMPTTSYIGNRFNQTEYWPGYISNIRIIKGTAAYDPTLTTLTVPTTPLTAVTNTQLLTLQYDQPQNNHTFLDSSSNQFLITRNGNATQGTFSPFSQAGWSSYFNGSDAYLSYTQAGSTYPSQLSFLNGASATGTIECWVYPLSSSQGTNPAEAPAIIAVGDTYFSLNVTTTNKARFYWYTTVVNNLDSTASVPFNAWTHIAAVRNGASVTLYINGASSGSIAYTGWNWASGSNGSQLKIGYHAPYSTARYFNGYISNLRIINGTALYTANFTPATSSLTAITNTSLLFCHTNRFVDSSVSNTVFTVSGAPQVQAFSPFAATAIYNPAVHGGSAYFDGTGDTLTVSQSLVNALTTMTIEGWFYINSSATYQGLWGGGVDLYGINLQYQETANQKLHLFIGSGGAWSAGNVSNTSLVPYTWYHIAYVRSGTTHWLYINGVVDSSINGVTNSVTWSGSTFYIGVPQLTTRYYNGYVANFRISNSRRYSADFIPPTGLLSSDANTIFLLNGSDAAILDSTGRHAIETVGDARTSAFITKFTGGSMYFDGSGDYLSIPASELFTLRTADFTVECWVYFINFNNQQMVGTLSTNSTTSWAFYVQGSTLIFSNWNVTAASYATSNLATFNWYHIATTRQSGTFRLFVNGTVVNSNTPAAQDYSSTQTLYIGDDVAHTGTGAFTGYINDLRITRGYARYIANFTAPTAPARLK